MRATPILPLVPSLPLRRLWSPNNKKEEEALSNAVRTVWNAGAIDTSHLGFRPIQKIATIHVSSGFIRGLPILLTRVRRMNAWTAAASIMILVSGAIATSQAQQPSTTLSPAALKEIAEVEAEIDRIEAQTLKRLTELPN